MGSISSWQVQIKRLELCLGFLFFIFVLFVCRCCFSPPFVAWLSQSYWIPAHLGKPCSEFCVAQTMKIAHTVNNTKLDWTYLPDTDCLKRYWMSISSFLISQGVHDEELLRGS